MKSIPEEGVIEVKTKHGKIVATEGGDPDYPGIWLEYLDKKGDGKKLSHPQVLMEQDDDGRIRLLIWDDPNDECHTREIIF